jgi:hypothetical protein
MHQIASITGLSKSVIYKIKSRMHITQQENLGGRPCLIFSPTRCHLSRKIKTGEINTVLEGTKMLTNQLSINCSNSTTRRAFKDLVFMAIRRLKNHFFKFVTERQGLLLLKSMLIGLLKTRKECYGQMRLRCFYLHQMEVIGYGKTPKKGSISAQFNQLLSMVVEIS